MLLGCTVMLMHWPMLSAKRYGSAARSQLSRGEHLAHTGTRQHTEPPGKASNSTRATAGLREQSPGHVSMSRARGNALHQDQAQTLRVRTKGHTNILCSGQSSVHLIPASHKFLSCTETKT